MDYVFAPNAERAWRFLVDNRFDVDRQAVIRLSYHDMLGERYTDADRLFVLDGCPPQMLTCIQMNLARARVTPQLISVEER